MEAAGIAKTKKSLSQLITKLECGELSEVVITRAGHPAAKLVPLAAATEKRLGVAKGVFEVPDDFDIRHGDEIGRMFNGSGLP